MASAGQPDAPPVACQKAMRNVNMLFDRSSPTYMLIMGVESLSRCRANDWISEAKKRVSRHSTMIDYNYYRESGIALKGADLVGLRKWFCNWMIRERRTSTSLYSDVFRPMLACGEGPGTNTTKYLPGTTTTTSTSSTLPAQLPIVTIRAWMGDGLSVGTAASVASNGNGDVIRYCILLNGENYYDVASSLSVEDGSGGTGLERSSGEYCFTKAKYEIWYWPEGFAQLRGGLFGTFKPVGCPNDETGLISICRTVKVSLRVTFENGRQVVSNSVNAYLRNRQNLYNGEVGWWSSEFSWWMCRDPWNARSGKWCPSGPN